MSRTVQTVDDVLRLLDSLFEPEVDRWTSRGGDWWDTFYDQRDRGIPFFVPTPDESLAEWYGDGRLDLPSGARVLELGCGPGRNAVWLAQQGYEVDALDLSAEALRWGVERAAEADIRVNFVHSSIFEWDVPGTAYDLVFDSGCFHHLPPHRRISYRALLEQALAVGGYFCLSCFAAGEGAMGSEATDEDCYRDRQLFGGLAYTDDDLRSIFSWLDEVELRRMREFPAGGHVFGQPFLTVGLFRR